MVKRMMALSIALFSLFLVHAQSSSAAQAAVPDAAEVLKDAAMKAGASDKKVFLIFHASWCGWCHKMDTAMADPAVKKYFDDNYVITHLTVLEQEEKLQLDNPGGEELLNKYTGGKETGIPFWVILDKDQNVLADSFLPGAGNMGCPAQGREVDQFIAVLKKTSTLDAKALGLIKARFLKIKAGH